MILLAVKMVGTTTIIISINIIENETASALCYEFSKLWCKQYAGFLMGI